MRPSVIVVAHVGAHHLGDSLGSLARDAERGAVEVVLVDNGSTDRTAARPTSWARRS